MTAASSQSYHRATMPTASGPLPRLFIGSAGETREIVDALEQELRDVARIERWDVDVFEVGHFTLEELTTATAEVDFAAFVLGQDDRTASRGSEATPSPRDNVIFEAGLFTAVLGRERTFYVVDSRGTKIPTDWAGLGYLTFKATEERARDKVYDAVKQIRARIRKLAVPAAPAVGARVAGSWWQLVENVDEGSVLSLLEIIPSGASVRVEGRSWSNQGERVAEYSSRTAALDDGESVLAYYWRGTNPRAKTAPESFGVGEITFTSDAAPATSGQGFFTTTSAADVSQTHKKFARYVRATPEDVALIRGGSRDQRRAIVERMLAERKSLDV